MHSGKSENNVTSQPDGKSKNNITSESGGKSEQSRAGVIAGGITGAILFVIIVVGILLFAQRKILRKQHEISLRVKTSGFKKYCVSKYIQTCKSVTDQNHGIALFENVAIIWGGGLHLQDI